MEQPFYFPASFSFAIQLGSVPGEAWPAHCQTACPSDLWMVTETVKSHRLLFHSVFWEQHYSPVWPFRSGKPLNDALFHELG